MAASDLVDLPGLMDDAKPELNSADTQLVGIAFINQQKWRLWCHGRLRFENC